MLHSSSEAYIYGQNAITHVAHCTALLFSLFSYNRDRVPVSQVFKQAAALLFFLTSVLGSC